MDPVKVIFQATDTQVRTATGVAQIFLTVGTVGLDVFSKIPHVGERGVANVTKMLLAEGFVDGALVKPQARIIAEMFATGVAQ